MDASIWLPVLAAAAFLTALVALGAAAAILLVWRMARRRWHLVRSHGLVVLATSAWAATSGRHRAAASSPPASEVLKSWTGRQVQRQLWRSVDAAGSAVRTAHDVGGPTGSLTGIHQRLVATASSLDRVLRLDPAATVPPAVAEQAGQVMAAAAEIQQAAVASAGDATGHRVRELVRDAEVEVRCLDAGLASSRAVSSRAMLPDGTG